MSRNCTRCSVYYSVYLLYSYTSKILTRCSRRIGLASRHYRKKEGLYSSLVSAIICRSLLLFLYSLREERKRQ